MMLRRYADTALNLAVLRVIVCGVMLISPETWTAASSVALPSELRVVPEGLRTLFTLVPIASSSARIAQGFMIAVCVCGLLGLASRVALGSIAVLGLYVWGLAQLSGSVLHDMHLLWFAGLLALSPCGDALSLDAWWRGKRGRAQPLAASPAYGIPLQCVRMLLGVIYFFPGFWKLHTSGLAWIFSDNLRNQMYWKWYQNGALPLLRIDRVPALLEIAALGVVLFELSFIASIWSRRTRWIAACAGFSFHIATDIFMFIPFLSLWTCYVALIDWSSFLSRWRRESAPPAQAYDANARSLPGAVLGVCLIAAATLQGARGAMQAWPFACYPTFQWLASDTIPDLRIEALLSDGSLRALPDGPATGGKRSPAAWASAWQVAGLYGSAASPSELRAYWNELRRSPAVAAAASGATSLRFYLAYYSVVPERWGSAPTQQRLLLELAL